MSQQIFAFEAAASELCSEKMAVEPPLHTNHLDLKQCPAAPLSLDRFRSPRSKSRSKASSAEQTTTTIKGNTDNAVSDITNLTTRGFAGFGDEVQRSPSPTKNHNQRTSRQLSPKRRSLSRRPSLPALSLCTSSRPPTRSLSNRESCRRPSYASFWSVEYHKAIDVSANESPAEISRGPLPDSEIPAHQPTYGHHALNSTEQSKFTNPFQEPKLVPIITNSVRPEKSSAKNPRKSPADEFKVAIRRLLRRQLPTVIKPVQEVQFVNVIHGTQETTTTEEDDYNPFALDLPLDVSQDKSELDYLRRTQEEECLEWQKLFSKQANTTTTKEDIATAPIRWISIVGIE